MDSVTHHTHPAMGDTWEGVEVTYDPTADAYYVDLQPEVMHRSTDMMRKRVALIDYAPNGTIAGIEVL